MFFRFIPNAFRFMLTLHIAFFKPSHSELSTHVSKLLYITDSSEKQSVSAKITIWVLPVLDIQPRAVTKRVGKLRGTRILCSVFLFFRFTVTQ